MELIKKKKNSLKSICQLNQSKNYIIYLFFLLKSSLI